jgi:hypothetical protein
MLVSAQARCLSSHAPYTSRAQAAACPCILSCCFACELRGRERLRATEKSAIMRWSQACRGAASMHVGMLSATVKTRHGEKRHHAMEPSVPRGCKHACRHRARGLASCAGCMLLARGTIDFFLAPCVIPPSLSLVLLFHSFSPSHS